MFAQVLTASCVAALALIVSVQGRPCVSGLYYCQTTIVNASTDFDTSYNATVQSLLQANPGSGAPLFACGANGALTYVKRCQYSCTDGGSGMTDYCDNARPCIQGLNYCQSTIVNASTNFDPAYAGKVQSLLAANAAPAGAGSPLFTCGALGALTFNMYCSGACTDGGSDKTDFCAASSASAGSTAMAAGTTAASAPAATTAASAPAATTGASAPAVTTVVMSAPAGTTGASAPAGNSGYGRK